MAWLGLAGCTTLLAPGRPELPVGSKAGAGRLVGLGMEDLPPLREKSRFRSPLDTLPGGGARLHQLEPFDPTRTPVVFVHGAGGSPRDWKTFVDHLDRRRFQAWLFAFPARQSPETLATLLYGELSIRQAEHPFPTVHFAAHSLGGLVVRSLLGRYSAQLPQARLFVSISTPWGGEPLARFAPPEIPAWSALNPRGPFLDSLFASRLSPAVDFHLFFGYRGNRLLRRGASDGTVSLSSELSPRAQAEARKVLGFDETHTSILDSMAVVAAFNQLLASRKPRFSPRLLSSK